MLVVDGFSRDDLISRLGTPWRGFSDQVMGGISKETIALAEIDGRRALRLTGDVRLENNGGFIQTALDLALQPSPACSSSCAATARATAFICERPIAFGPGNRTGRILTPGLSGGRSGCRSRGLSLTG